MSDISKRLEEQANLLFNNIAGWETNALRRIGRRVKDIKSLSYADLQAINNATIVNQDVNAILDELAELTGQNAREVKRIYSDMIEMQHEENKVLYDYRKKPFIPFAENKELQSIVMAYARTTAETMVNLSMTKARQLGAVDINGNFIPIEKNFKNILDKAVMSVTTGTGDFGSEMRSVLKELGGSGLRVDYGGGVTRRVDTMVRQNILWGAKQASIEYNEMIGKELGCDGIEIDWHSNPRPSHEFMQGKQYILGQSRTINGKYFESADSALAALEDYGCLHFKTPIICGISEPRYTPEELKELNEKNAKPITIDGVTKSGYEWKQTMRRLETEGRKTRDQMEILKASGDNEGVRQLKDKFNLIQDKYNIVAKGADIKAQPEKMSIVKGNNIKAVDKSAESGIIKTGYATANSIFVNKNEALYRYAKKVVPLEDYEDIVCHANPTAFEIDVGGKGLQKDFITISPKEFAQKINNSTGYHGGNIRLIACQSGAIENGAAQQIANILGVDVYAPTENVHIDSDGNMFVSNNEVLAEMWNISKDKSTYKETGVWKLFRPQNN